MNREVNGVACCHTAVLHMVCGKIASGKSSITARLATAPRTVLLSEDAWMACLYPDEIRTLADYVSRTARIRTLLTGHIQSLLAADMSVVLDFPFNTVASRTWGASLFQAVGCAHRLHYLDVSDEICKSRLKARNLSGEHPFQTSEAQFDQITRYFVPPAKTEGFNLVIYDATGTVRCQADA